MSGRAEYSAKQSSIGRLKHTYNVVKILDDRHRTDTVRSRKLCNAVTQGFANVLEGSMARGKEARVVGGAAHLH